MAPKNLGLIGHLRKDEFASFMIVGAEFAETLVVMNGKIIEALDAAIAALTNER